MRIGEIAIIGPHGPEKEMFIKAVCQQVEKSDDNLCFGRLEINDQLVLHLYGIGIEEGTSMAAWDLVSRKMLGYVVIFNWYQPDSLKEIKTILDFFTLRYEAPVIVVANIGDGPLPIPEKLFEGGLTLSEEGKFLFCRLTDEKSVKKTVVTLLNIIIERMP